uniref:Uncharacterized protein n=1 Tax=Alexandrium monilatum TaxID=311494 RepID=A0A7S4T7X5_9DINO
MATSGNVWEVVGGCDKGGILVRSGRGLTAPLCADRLVSGSLVIAVEHDEEAGRLHFELLVGAGPPSGWVSTRVQGKDILVRTGEYDASEGDVEALRWYSSELERSRCGAVDELGFQAEDGEEGQELQLEKSLWHGGQPQPGTLAPASNAEVAISRPRVRMTTTVCAPTRPCRGPGVRYAVPRRHRQTLPGRPAAGIGAQAKLDPAARPLGQEARELDLGLGGPAGVGAGRPGDSSNPEEEHTVDALHAEQADAQVLCPHCGLPVGDRGYEGESHGLLHAECKAQLVLSGLQKEVLVRQQEEAKMKQARRARFGIGWSVERIPRNAVLASSLQCGAAPRGMFCLVLEHESRTVRIVPTIDSRSSVNLEYLAIALQVRSREGREPLFSLDPEKDFVSAFDGKCTMQAKRFEPSWLAGTSAGEVMFQADYFLKELSMGEHEQPVVGLKSCFDISAESGWHEAWRAREWFVIRKADVLLSPGRVLTPYVKMGVEAREQVQGPHGFEDARITRPDHPLVKYAEAFTHYFDLIAERRSVIFHLREMAKATVIAKFLIEGGFCLEDAWFSAADFIEVADSAPKIPQLWNERMHSRVQVEDGAIVAAEEDFGTRTHGVYGGIELGLEQVTEFGASRVTGGTGIGAAPIQAHILAKIKAGAAMDASVDNMIRFGAARATALIAGGFAVQPQALPANKTIEAMSAVAPQGAVTLAKSVQTFRGMRPSRAAPRRGPKGVDLSLDDFELSTPSEVAQVTPSMAAGQWAGESAVGLETHITISRAFWSSLSSAVSVFSEEDRTLLSALFNPALSDRRQEGDLFIPPDTSLEYVHKLRGLIKEEDEFRLRRKEHFLSKDFVPDNPGPLFPSSWKSTFGVQRRQACQGSLQRPPMCRHILSDGELARLKAALKSAVAAFDKSVEDGTRFQVYEVGSLEVRTLQEPGDEEQIGAAFTPCAAVRSASTGGARDCDRIVKVTEFVERVNTKDLVGHDSTRAVDATGPISSDCQYYVVLESQSGDAVLTEKCANGRVTWVVNPKGLDARNSLAKVLACMDCEAGRITVRELKLFQVGESRCSRPGASTRERREYARSVCCLALRVPPA